MKNRLINIAFILSSLLVLACSNGNGDFDATGTFESEEIIVSSEAMGKLVMFQVEEGMQLKQNQIVGVVDTTQLHLKKKQLLSSINAVLSKQPDVNTQLAALKEQIKTAEVEKKRMLAATKVPMRFKSKNEQIFRQHSNITSRYFIK